MLGGTTKGFCRREWTMWYGDMEDASPCQLPLSDGEACGDVFAGRDDPRNTSSGKERGRCPYNTSCGLHVDMEKCQLTTYARHYDKVLATGGAGLKAHDPESL